MVRDDVRCNGCSNTRPSISAGASFTPPTRRPRKSARFARTGAVAGLCPITEASLGDGIFPAREFVDAGGALRHRHGFQCAGRRRRRAAPARIWPAAQAPRAQRALCRRRPLDGTRAVRSCACRRRAGAGADVSRSHARCARRHRHARHHASLAGGTRARRRPSTAGSLPRAAARSIASGPAATRSSKAAGTDCARPRANTSTHRCGGSLHEPRH